MITDRMCLDCGKYRFDLDDAEGGLVREGGSDRYDDRGRFYVVVECPACERPQGLVIRPRVRPTVFTIWPGSWNDEPCQNDYCDYCEGDYV